MMEQSTEPTNNLTGTFLLSLGAFLLAMALMTPVYAFLAYRRKFIGVTEGRI